jgi:large subunit ribosomal protein L21
MYAIVKTGGMQFKVFPNEVVRVPKIEAQKGDRVSLDEVLLVQDEDQTIVGAPMVTGAQVTAEVMSHGKGDKVAVFKMKKRKNYRRNKGHRQDYTELLIKEVTVPKGR